MKIKTNLSVWEDFVYCMLCIFTLGSAYLIRILISQAIAIEKNKNNKK